jgi:hypothetical protein
VQCCYSACTSTNWLGLVSGTVLGAMVKSMTHDAYSWHCWHCHDGVDSVQVAALEYNQGHGQDSSCRLVLVIYLGVYKLPLDMLTLTSFRRAPWITLWWHGRLCMWPLIWTLLGCSGWGVSQISRLTGLVEVAFWSFGYSIFLPKSTLRFGFRPKGRLKGKRWVRGKRGPTSLAHQVRQGPEWSLWL